MLFRAAMLLGLCLAVAGFSMGTAGHVSAEAQKEKHPHIHAALRELKEARKELKEADHDFGGHRADAIDAIDKAVMQLEKALKFDKK